ncbi:hypothetical protein VE00_07813 [Pseudogymnoascus sp. WSF 3629]|nr:hypothetical protein VE00_07813 [Pseudogymnoascus sp. WSF 3629]
MDSSVKQPGVDKDVKRLWITKLSLRCIAIIFSLILVGLCVAGDYPNIMLIGPAGAALLWNIAEGITLFVRRRAYKGIRPGACVGVDLVLWLAVGGMSGYTVPVLLMDMEYYYDRFSSLHVASVAVEFITTAIIVALFIIACVETHRRRNANVPHAPAPFYPNQQQGTFNPNQPPFFNQNQQPRAFNPNAPFNPYQPHAPFNPN